MKAFTRIVERRSFTQAAKDLGLPRSSVTDAVKQLEERLGLGLIQAPRYRLEEDFGRGTRVPVLAQHPPTPTPVSLMYPRNRQLSPRVRVFIDWVSRVFAGS
ncbi:LysR family transcriptional regulator [Corallococcus sp. AB049A]|uniref:LysR family transcriptional regulator n=1 Tax=Corallococcus interemptor TaxID=2316720 RepID=A0A3A8Q9Y7_9BACT|nr:MULTISPECIES: LysR family transcriptional regulator [Corallococcus]RKH49428.1 LysR family transcriptional regulator [Corallococcus sp. AB050B]RKH63035.1 LysR family transcriptional regulator [Corallococcus interemptor]RKI70311.1 LysR family transcriptional regulator [Corallococcus sp. AB049A]